MLFTAPPGLKATTAKYFVRRHKGTQRRKALADGERHDEDLCVRQTTSMQHNSLSTAWQRLYLPPDCAHVPSPWEILLRGGAWTGERSEHKWELSIYTDDYPDCSQRTNKQNTGRSQEPRVAGSPNALVFSCPLHGVRKMPLVGPARASAEHVQRRAVAS